MKASLAAAGVVGALALAACGSSDNGGGGNSSKPGNGAVVAGKPGGTLHIMSNGDVDYIDPGAAYYGFTFIVTYATQRPLYSYKPDDATKAVPDLAAGPAKVSADAKTVTVKLRRGVKFSPPVNREVTSADVK